MAPLCGTSAICNLSDFFFNRRTQSHARDVMPNETLHSATEKALGKGWKRLAGRSMSTCSFFGSENVIFDYLCFGFFIPPECRPRPRPRPRQYLLMRPFSVRSKNRSVRHFVSNCLCFGFPVAFALLRLFSRRYFGWSINPLRMAFA